MRPLIVWLILLLLLLLNGCVTPAVKRPVQTESTAEWQAETLDYDELIDPTLLTEPTWEIDESDYLHELEANLEDLSSRQDSLVFGYRVQLVATRDLIEAQEIQQRALLLFGSAGVYYEYDPPLYRIRVGNCPDRKSAGRLLQRSRALGYPRAWIVQSLILTTPAE
ncbi:MAG: SPOR domain-containing protein [Candidatus Delongbacteria bacterium]|nr:SPOR domain-containing protein [Candidatus Delongbacteria bacterium]